MISAVLPLRRARVDGDQRLRLGELHPLLDRVRREAAEDDVVRGADPRAGEHRDGDLGDHRQVDADDVAGLDPALLEHVGEPLDVAVQVGVGDVALLALLAVPVEGDPVAAAGLDVAVEAVVRGVQLAVGEPLVERRVRSRRGPCPRARNQSSSPASFSHQACGIARRLLVQRLVGDQRRGAETPRAARSAPGRAARRARARDPRLAGSRPPSLLLSYGLPRPQPRPRHAIYSRMCRSSPTPLHRPGRVRRDLRRHRARPALGRRDAAGAAALRHRARSAAATSRSAIVTGAFAITGLACRPLAGAPRRPPRPQGWS